MKILIIVALFEYQLSCSAILNKLKSIFQHFLMQCLFTIFDVIKIRLKEWLLIFPSISTKQTTTSHIKPLKTKILVLVGISSNMWYGNWISNDNTGIKNKRTNIRTDSMPLKKTTRYHKNEWQHKHWQYNSTVGEYL